MTQVPDSPPTVELWRTRVRSLDPAFLAPTDRRRWDEFVLAPDRDRLATAALLRDHVLRRHGRPTTVARWCAVCRSDRHGGVRPPDTATWRLSVSHAGDVVVIAYADSAVVELGVDVERVARFRPDMARFVQGPGERRRGPLDLARAWTLKEAVLKAAGCGLHVSPTSLEIRHSRRDPSRARVRVRTSHPLLQPVRDLPGIATDVTAPLGLDPAMWRAALFVLGATRVEVEVHALPDDERQST